MGCVKKDSGTAKPPTPGPKSSDGVASPVTEYMEFNSVYDNGMDSVFLVMLEAEK